MTQKIKLNNKFFLIEPIQGVINKRVTIFARYNTKYLAIDKKSFFFDPATDVIVTIGIEDDKQNNETDYLVGKIVASSKDFTFLKDTIVVFRTHKAIRIETNENFFFLIPEGEIVTFIDCVDNTPQKHKSNAKKHKTNK